MKDGKLSEHDIQYLNLWNAGYRGHGNIEEYAKKVENYAPMPSKYRFSVTRVAAGFCLDCEQKRCETCNGCVIDIFDKNLESHHCQRCICDNSYQSEEPLNNTGIPLEKLVRQKQGWHRNNKKEGRLK